MTTSKALVLEQQHQDIPFALRILLPAFRAIEIGQLQIELADGRRLNFTGRQDGPVGELRMVRPTRLLMRLLTNAGMGLAQGFLAGDWSSNRLTATLELFARNEAGMTAAFRGRRLLAGLDRLQHRLRHNDKRGSRRNIRFHYDLGNDFYRLWLDPDMTYSGARFHTPDESLTAAQDRKYAALLESLHARPGDHILEIGCGWGGFAEYAARQGHRVTALTISPAQFDYARERIRQAGLGTRVDIRLEDYRDIAGEFDHVVSIEMFEAVGREYWPGFFRTLQARLRPGGRAALQIIVIAEAAYRAYSRRTDFIQKYVFPGGMLPSASTFAALATGAGFRMSQCGFHGKDYARTLRHWEHRFLCQRNGVLQQGFDERFIRLWRYYLAYCQAGFMSGRVDLMQTTLIRSPV